MNAKENYLAYLDHEDTQWIPTLIGEVVMAGGALEYWENGPAEGGLDGFGNNWIPTDSAGGQPALDPDIIPLQDICDWEDVVTFPDLDAIDWKTYAEKQLNGIDRNEMTVEYHTWNSIFLRLTHLMGFENALCAFYEEPEATKALCNALGDYKIALIERAAKYFQPDAYVHYDDVATERDLFMAPEVYREFIKPVHTRMNDAARALGIIPEIHVCGKCESIIPDLIEEGSQAWQSAQPVNDLCKIIETYGRQIGVTGGYDTQGRPASPDVTPEEIAADVDRCVDTYGTYGYGYAFFGFLLGNNSDPAMGPKYGAMYGRLAERNAALRGA